MTGSSRQPNLIYVFADELGYRHCGYSGNPRAPTRNIDGLAAAGVSFRQAVSATPVCAAYRASLLTGKYTTSTGMVINELRMNPDHECIGHVLTRGGYETAYIGKWHLWANQLGDHDAPRNGCIPPGPHRLGFDGHWAAYNFHHDYFGSHYYHDEPVKIPYGPADVYEPDAQTDLAIDVLDRHAGSDRPLAMFLSYGTPHGPWPWTNVPDRYAELFRNVDFPPPPNYSDQDDPYADRWGRFKDGERSHLEQWQQVYYAMVANLDNNLARLLEAIDRAGMTDDTLVVFTSDHGEMFGAHGRRAKNIFYEEAVRVPLLMRWPGRIPAGSISDACINTPDIMPTLLSLLGLPIPEEVEGMDLARSACDRPGPTPQAALLQNTGGCADWLDGHEWRALRDGRYTYAIFRLDRSELLFDNLSDPYQMKNLAAEPAAAPILDRFGGMLEARMSDLRDTFECCTWYRDRWTADRVILRGAKG